MVKDRLIFDLRQQMTKQIFHVQSHLPDQVFRADFNNFLYGDSDWLTDRLGWEAIQQAYKSVQVADAIYLGEVGSDDLPASSNSFHVIKLHTSASSKEYMAALNEAPEGLSDTYAMMYGTSEIVCFPSSMEWAIWCDRKLEVMVLANKVGIDRPAFYDSDLWFPIEHLILEWLPGHV